MTDDDKRGDLLKMHAYKDAIRRIGGAYILYPGDMPERKKGFHEVIPGLGTFCLTPGDTGNQEKLLKSFIKDVVIHFLDRTSQREKIAISNKEIYKQHSPGFYGSFPEPSCHNSAFPDTTEVLIGCYKDQVEYYWYIKNHKFAICIGNSKEGAIMLLTSMPNLLKQHIYYFITTKQKIFKGYIE